MIEFTIGKYDRIDSTNKLMRSFCEAKKCEEGFIITTDYQSFGKGYGSNIWESEFGKNLLFSLCLSPDFLSAEKQFYLSMIICLSITSAINQEIKEENISIKWPNDIYYQSKKLGGILIENSISGRNISQSIIGIGLNVNQMEFNKDLPNPISLANITSQEINRDDFLEKILDNINSYYLKLRNSEFSNIKTEYLNLLYLRGIKAKYMSMQSEFLGEIVGVDEFGQLEIQTHNEIKKFGFKEIEYLI